MTWEPWRYRPAEVGRLTRRYVLDILFGPRGEQGRPLLPAEPQEQPGRYLYALAVRRGLPHEAALEWARKAAQKPKRRKGKGRVARRGE